MWLVVSILDNMALDHEKKSAITTLGNWRNWQLIMHRAPNVVISISITVQ